MYLSGLFITLNTFCLQLYVVLVFIALPLLFKILKPINSVVVHTLSSNIFPLFCVAVISVKVTVAQKNVADGH